MPQFFWTKILSFTILSSVQFCLSATTNCSYLQSKVPKPQLQYMLGGSMNVIWQEDSAAPQNYTAHACYTSQRSYLNIAQLNSCPQFQVLTSCKFTRQGNFNEHLCSFAVAQYFEYTVYLRGITQQCQLTGKQVKIRPRMSIAYPGRIPMLNVYNISGALLIEWTKSLRYVQLLYSLRCQQLETGFKQHFCCIRARLPYGISPNYSELCKNSGSIGKNSNFQCGVTHECKMAKVNNLKDFAGHLMPDDSSWPFSPPSMLLQIEKRP